MRLPYRATMIGVAWSVVLLAWAGTVAAQSPVTGATAAPTTAPGAVQACPVSLEQAIQMAGMPMRPNPMYVTQDGTLYVEHLERIPGGDPETTIYTCGYLSEKTDGRPYGVPDRQLFLSFAVGDSAAWLWELNGPGIVADPSFVPLVDADATTVDVYRQTTSFEADGEALTVPRWQVRDYLQSGALFGDVIVSAAGDTQDIHDQTLLMASLVGLAIEEATAP